MTDKVTVTGQGISVDLGYTELFFENRYRLYEVMDLLRKAEDAFKADINVGDRVSDLHQSLIVLGVHGENVWVENEQKGTNWLAHLNTLHLLQKAKRD